MTIRQNQSHRVLLKIYCVLATVLHTLSQIWTIIILIFSIRKIKYKIDQNTFKQHKYKEKGNFTGYEFQIPISPFQYCLSVLEITVSVSSLIQMTVWVVLKSHCLQWKKNTKYSNTHSTLESGFSSFS
jgi:hypothetical protein